MNNENRQNNIIFFDGFYSEDVPSTAPEYIMGKGTIAIDKMITFLNNNRHIAVNGGIKYTIKLAKTGKRYVEVDQYGMQKYKEYMEKKTQEQPPQPQYTLEDISQEYATLDFDSIQ